MDFLGSKGLEAKMDSLILKVGSPQPGSPRLYALFYVFGVLCIQGR